MLQLDVQTSFGGITGIDSPLDRFPSFSKILHIHAILHDASGFMKRKWIKVQVTVMLSLSWNKY